MAYDRWASSRPYREEVAIWKPTAHGADGRPSAWRIYLGALCIEIFVAERNSGLWLYSAKPFITAGVAGRLTDDQAKTVALVQVQELLRQHAAIVENAI
jgi:hypothetical protein